MSSTGFKSKVEYDLYRSSVGLIPFIEGAKAKLEGKTYAVNPYGASGCEFLGFRQLWSDGHYAMSSEMKGLMTEAGMAFAAGKTKSPYIDECWKTRFWDRLIAEFERGNGSSDKLKATAEAVVAKIGKASKIESVQVGPENGNIRMGLFTVPVDYKGPMSYSYVRFANNKVLFAYKAQGGIWHLFHYTKGEKVGEAVLSTNVEGMVLADMHTRSRGAGQIGRHWHVAGAYDMAFKLEGIKPEQDDYIATGEENQIRFPLYEVVKRSSDAAPAVKGA